jgi:predicted ester cyclase
MLKTQRNEKMRAPGATPQLLNMADLTAKLRECENDQTKVLEHLKKFDALDFDIFSNQKWKRLDESHTDDVRVIWPDGHETQGLKEHAGDLAAMFVALPDLKIRSHPVSFGSGDWTAAIGVMEGTFTNPMPAGTGKTTVKPNGKKLNLRMATLAHWNEGRIYEQYLFWDNVAYKKQLGLSK